jgi:hypothetical protein
VYPAALKPVLAHPGQAPTYLGDVN